MDEVGSSSSGGEAGLEVIQLSSSDSESHSRYGGSGLSDMNWENIMAEIEEEEDDFLLLLFPSNRLV